MTSLKDFLPYTSYRLHWLPYEITRCGYQASMVSTRALYGNHKSRPQFSTLGPPRRLGLQRSCSLCRATFFDAGLFRVWVSLMVGTDVLPLLVKACSEKCLSSLPSAPHGYLREPHRGGPQLPQPARGLPSVKRP